MIKKVKAFNDILKFIRHHRKENGISSFSFLTTGSEIIIITNPLGRAPKEIKDTLRIKYKINK